MIMAATTIKTITDVDYLVYLDKDLHILGYEMSEDDKQAFQLRYKSTQENCGIEGKVPAKTAFTLEVYGINTTLAFVMDEDKGELLFYRPSPIHMASEIGKTIDTAIPYPPEEVKNLPEVAKTVSDLFPEQHDDSWWIKVVDKVPYPGWMDECWGTKAWIQIWKNKPDLHTSMLQFSTKKYEEREKEYNEQNKS